MSDTDRNTISAAATKRKEALLDSIDFLKKAIAQSVEYAEDDEERLSDVRDVLLIAYADINGNRGGLARIGVRPETIEWLRGKW